MHRSSTRAAQRRRAVALLVRAVVALVASSAAVPLLAQDTRCDPGDVEVRAVRFEGNRAFADAELGSLIVTTPSSWVTRVPVLGPLASPKRCLDPAPATLGDDARRLVFYYRKRGYTLATVDTAVRTAGDGLVVTFRIAEGTPVRIDSLALTGLDSVRRRERIVGNLPIRPGDPFDEYALAAATDTIAQRLRNNGYPRAQVLRSFVVRKDVRTADVELRVEAGPLTRIGAVDIAVRPDSGRTQQIADRTVRDLLDIDSGAVYSERRLVEGQRALYQTEAYQAVRIELDSAGVGGSDSLVRIRVRADEGRVRLVNAGIGWGTVDCFRTQGSFTHYDFLGDARRLDLVGRVSRIGTGAPLDFMAPIQADGFARQGAGGICRNAAATPSVDDGDGDDNGDAYGGALNYYIGATVRQRELFGIRTLPALTIFREVRSEYNAFRREVEIGGNLSMSGTRVLRTPTTVGYTIEQGRTIANSTFFCILQQICDASGLAAVQGRQRLAVANAVVSRRWANDIFTPTSGAAGQLEARHASPLIGSDGALQFNKLVGDFSAYTSLGGSREIAVRVRFGGILDTRGISLRTNDARFIPVQERLYLGGPNTVRGFRPNELGPAVYRLLNDDTSQVRTFTLPNARGEQVRFAQLTDSARPRVQVIPVGGNTMVMGSVEFRTRSALLPNLLQFAFFADVGEVWQRDTTLAFQYNRLKWTPGAGLRIRTFFGALRLDVAYNGNEREAAPLYLDQGFGSGSELLCVLRAGTPPLDAPAQCPAFFSPPVRRRFLSLLTPTISLGQAF